MLVHLWEHKAMDHEERSVFEVATKLYLKPRSAARGSAIVLPHRNNFRFEIKKNAPRSRLGQKSCLPIC